MTEEKTKRPGMGLRVLVALLVIAIGALIAIILVWFSPEVEKRKPKEHSPLVQTLKLKKDDHRATVLGYGTLQPEKTASIASEASGRIQMASPKFRIGGEFKQGELMLMIDPADMLLRVRQAQASLASAEHALRMEEAEAEAARKENHGIEAKDNRSSMLLNRESHLQIARANVESAKAALEVAKRNHENAAVRAPFDLVILETFKQISEIVSMGTPLASVASANRFHLVTKISQEDLRWVNLEMIDKGSVKIRVNQKDAFVYHARALNVLNRLENNSRFARILLELEAEPSSHPERSLAPPARLLSGAFAEVELTGIVLPDTFSLPDLAIREGDKVYILTPEMQLDIRPVQVLRRQEDEVFVTGSLNEGEDVIVSSLFTPIQGMKLSLLGNAAKDKLPADEKQEPSP